MFSHNRYSPAVASPTEQLYEQMTSNPAFTKRNIQNANSYLLNILVLSKLFGHVSHCTEQPGSFSRFSPTRPSLLLRMDRLERTLWTRLSTELVRMCLACQHFDFNSADWFSNNVDVSSSWYLRRMGKEFDHSFQHTLVHEAGTRDEPLRTSAWEATKQRKQSYAITCNPCRPGNTPHELTYLGLNRWPANDVLKLTLPKL